jgi:hypothetical protein
MVAYLLMAGRIPRVTGDMKLAAGDPDAPQQTPSGGAALGFPVFQFPRAVVGFQIEFPGFTEFFSNFHRPLKE